MTSIVQNASFPPTPRPGGFPLRGCLTDGPPSFTFPPRWSFLVGTPNQKTNNRIFFLFGRLCIPLLFPLSITFPSILFPTFSRFFFCTIELPNTLFTFGSQFHCLQNSFYLPSTLSLAFFFHSLPFVEYSFFFSICLHGSHFFGMFSAMLAFSVAITLTSFFF